MRACERREGKSNTWTDSKRSRDSEENAGVAKADRKKPQRETRTPLEKRNKKAGKNSGTLYSPLSFSLLFCGSFWRGEMKSTGRPPIGSMAHLRMQVGV